MIRKILLGMVMTAFSLCLVLPVCNNTAMVAEATETTEEAGTYNNVYRWVYKVENGKTYMRLWDYGCGVWVTDWILVE